VDFHHLLLAGFSGAPTKLAEWVISESCDATQRDRSSSSSAPRPTATGGAGSRQQDTIK
jgi:hypothetical protein